MRLRLPLALGGQRSCAHALGGHGDGPNGGDNFLVSQLHYLRGLDCSGADPKAPEIHFVCTERFNEDWHAVLRRFGHGDGNGTRGVKSHTRSAAAHTKANALSVLDAEDEEFVRRAMFPWDAALWRHVCGGGAGGR